MAPLSKADVAALTSKRWNGEKVPRRGTEDGEHRGTGTLLYAGHSEGFEPGAGLTQPIGGSGIGSSTGPWPPEVLGPLLWAPHSTTPSAQYAADGVGPSPRKVCKILIGKIWHKMHRRGISQTGYHIPVRIRQPLGAWRRTSHVLRSGAVRRPQHSFQHAGAVSFWNERGAGRVVACSSVVLCRTAPWTIKVKTCGPSKCAPLSGAVSFWGGDQPQLAPIGMCWSRMSGCQSRSRLA